MKLRKRAPARVINEENEEDVDDPADDSDCDPEWEEPEVNSDIPFGSGRKRKSFIPLQMQNDGSKAKIVDQADKPSFIPLQMQNDGSKAKIVDQADKPSSSGAGVSSEKIAQTSSKPTKVNPKSSPKEQGYDITTHSMIVTNGKGITNKCQFKVLKKEPAGNVNITPSTSKQPVQPPPAFSHGDFLKDITRKGDWIWQVDGMNLLQKFVPVKDPKTGLTLYKSSFTYDGLNALNSPKFQKISAVIVNKIKNETFVRVNEDLNPLEVKIKGEPISEDVVSSSQENDLPVIAESAVNSQEEKNKATHSVQRTNLQSLPSIKKEATQVPPPALVDTPSIANYKNTFKDDFTVFLQALISQCLDPTFLRTTYADNDEYFIEKIKTIDDVLEAKKFSLMSLPTFPNVERILYAIHSYPEVEEKQLPAIKMENLNCVVCAEQGVEKLPVCSNLCLELTGEPYERNTLIPVKLLVDIDDDLKVLRVCTSCSKILKLYSKMCHTKYLIYTQCKKSVEKIMEKQKDMEEADVIFNLLNNDPWCETKLLHIIKDWIAVDDLKKES